MGELGRDRSNQLVASRAKAKRLEREVPEVVIDALDHRVGDGMFKILGFETRVFTAVAEGLNEEGFKKLASMCHPNRVSASHSAETESSERHHGTLVRGSSPGSVRRHGRHHISFFGNKREKCSGCGRQPKCSLIRLNRGGTESGTPESGSSSHLQGLVSSNTAAVERP